MAPGRKPDRPDRAAAVRFDPDTDRAPKVVAAGRGAVAERIVDLAIKNNVPVHEDPDVMEILSKVEIEEEIPYELYQAIAQILAFVYRENERWKSRHTG